jgi:hypothetical protein
LKLEALSQIEWVTIYVNISSKEISIHISEEESLMEVNNSLSD